MSKIPKSEEAREAVREELVRLLLDEVDRTFATEGREDGLRTVGDLFRRLDETTLCDLAYSMGLETDQQLETKEDER
jgi:hypothetical protein